MKYVLTFLFFNIYFDISCLKFYGFQKEVIKSRNKDLVELFNFGIGVHHAGMLRADRGLTERLFSDGLLKVELLHLWLKPSFLDNRLIERFFVSGSCLYSYLSMGCKSACSYCCRKGKRVVKILILYCF